MATKKKSAAKKPAARPTPAQVIKDIRKRYGDIIDLKASPALMLEILGQFGHVLDPNGGTGGVSPGTSTVAVGITPPSDVFDRAAMEEVLKAVLKLQKQVSVMSKQIAKIK